MYNHTTPHTQSSTINNLSSPCASGAKGEARRGSFAHESAQGVCPNGETGILLHPPTREAQELHPPTVNRATIDYLAYTFFPLDVGDRDYFLRKFTKYVGGAVPAKRHARNYTHTLNILGSGSVSWHHDRLEMGVHIELGGQALANWCKYLDRETGAYALMIYLRGWSYGRFTRGDVAIDTCQFTTEEFEQAIHEGQLVTRLQKQEFWRNNKGGHTIYIGSRAGEGRYIRCYNKAAEQGLDEDVTWTRLEIEHKGYMADLLVTQILASDVTLEGIVASALDFREVGRTRTNNRERSAWWSAFIGEHSFVSFAINRAKGRVESVKDWFRRSVAPSLAYLVAKEGGDWLWLHEEVRNAIHRIAPEQKSELYLQGVPV